MNINEKDTVELDQILSQTKTGELDDYLNTQTVSSAESVAEYLTSFLAQTGQKKKDVISRSGLSEAYGYHILNGTKVTNDRDKILGLCIGAGMDLVSASRALKLAGFSPLYSKIDRDAVIMLCINRGINNVLSVNEELEKRGMPRINL